MQPNHLNRLSRKFALLPALAAGLPLLGAAALPLLGARPVLAQERGLEAAKTSQVAPITLPDGAHRATGKGDVAQFADALGNVARANQQRVGEIEALIWQNGDAPKKALPGLLKEAGYQYVAQPAVAVDAGQITTFAAASADKKSGVVGMWLEQGDAIMLVWGSVTKAAGAPANEPERQVAPPAPAPAGDAAPAAPAPAGAITLELDAKAYTVNVMGKAMPRIPAFPELAPKPGFVRGYVYDTNGKPLAGAKLGVRSTATGGYYSGAQGKSDAKGYYEIAVPFGAAHFYNAGFAVDYGEGRAGLGLHPADGEEDGFASNVGEVENWVLLPYGIADRDGVQENPKYCNNYYGGTVILGWYADEDERWPDPKKLPPDGQIEVTLTPEGPLVDGSPSRPIVIRKPVDMRRGFLGGELYINNIPVGAYKIAARLVGGGALKMQETGPSGGKSFGIAPKEATGTATLLLRPDSGKADEAGKAHGNWDHIQINLERP